jgi:hypothetical protein
MTAGLECTCRIVVSGHWAFEGDDRKTTIMIFSMRGALAALILLELASVARAQTAVVPSAFAATEGNISFAYTSTLQITYQQVYGTALLGALTPGTQITGMSFRLDGGSPNGPTTAYNFANFDIRIGTSVFAPGSLSSTVASNLGGDTVLARSGALSFGVNSFFGGAGANPFGPVITFTTPYTYNGGHLLLTVSHSAGGGSNIAFDAASTLGTNAQYRQEFGTYNSATTSQNVGSIGLITQFQTAVVIPEPGTLALLALGATLGLVVKRRP